MNTEKELIFKVQKGDVRAFSDLVNLHKNMVYSLIYRMVKPSEDAEEVAQDTFLKAFKAIKQFEGKSKFSTWLYKIAYFTALNHLRKNKLLTCAIDMRDFAESDSSVLDDLNEEDQEKYIQKAMDYLKPIERNLITLFYLKEFSNKEIQEITGMSEVNIKSGLFRTRKKLFGILKYMLKDELETIVRN